MKQSIEVGRSQFTDHGSQIKDIISLLLGQNCDLRSVNCEQNQYLLQIAKVIHKFKFQPTVLS